MERRGNKPRGFTAGWQKLSRIVATTLFLSFNRLEQFHQIDLQAFNDAFAGEDFGAFGDDAPPVAEKHLEGFLCGIGDPELLGSGVEVFAAFDDQFGESVGGRDDLGDDFGRELQPGAFSKGAPAKEAGIGRQERVGIFFQKEAAIEGLWPGLSARVDNHPGEGVAKG